MDNQVQTEKAITVTISHLNTLAPSEIANDDRVRAMFVKNYNAIHKSNAGGQVYELEKYYFSRAVSSSKDLRECTKLSLYATFIEMAVQGLSFDPGKKLCYLVPQNVNTGTKDAAVWEKRATLEISPYGELAIRQDMGQIQSADNPQVVYEKESFKVFETATGKQIQHEYSYPREGKIVACYIRIIKSDGANDYFILDAAGMQRLKGYSAKKNKGYANALYGGDGEPDMGFWIAKTIKHAFKAYPKVKIKGSYTKLQEPQDDDETIDYGDISDHEVIPTVKVNNSSPETLAMTSHVDEENGESVVINDEINF